MKISKLIALLEQAKSEFGDREVMLWNGFAQDVVPMNPEFVPETLYRPKKETFARSYAGFRIRDVVERAQKDNPSRTYKEVADTIPNGRKRGDKNIAAVRKVSGYMCQYPILKISIRTRPAMRKSKS